MSADNIIDKAVKYIETHFGETPIERNDKAMEAMQTLRRDKDEDMSEFIQRFEGVMEQLKVVRFELEGRLEAALLHRTANLTKQEANNVSSKVDMASNDTDLVSKLKAALRQVGFRKEGSLEVKNEVVLQAETIEEIAPDQGTYDAYYGYQPQNRNRNQQGQQGQQRNQGQGQVLGQGQFGQGQFRQWTQPANNNNQTINQNGF